MHKSQLAKQEISLVNTIRSGTRTPAKPSLLLIPPNFLQFLRKQRPQRHLVAAGIGRHRQRGTKTTAQYRNSRHCYFFPSLSVFAAKPVFRPVEQPLDIRPMHPNHQQGDNHRKRKVQPANAALERIHQ